MKQTKIPFRLHPRVFASLGAELVTNDLVAIIELVKNSYDAAARRVDVRFRKTTPGGKIIIEIEDDGVGMSRSIIENVWCVVATPYRIKKRLSKVGRIRRRVSGEKGLGRLSAARLGSKLELITKTSNGPCWQVNLSWNSLSTAKSLNACNVVLNQCNSKAHLDKPGTLIRISGLRRDWDELRIKELREQLSRLIPPFEGIDDFGIWLQSPETSEAEPLEIKPPHFLSQPPYLLTGQVDSQGNLIGDYKHSTHNAQRNIPVKFTLWSKGLTARSHAEKRKSDRPDCGPFSFEIRVWDIDSDSIEEISKRFEQNRSTIRRDIRNYRGVSLYRDKILVLPKSDISRDWLGLDLRRVSRVGTRVSTSQIVGYVSISAETNKKIKDTSDRERLEENQAVSDFKFLLQRVMEILEEERDKDRSGKKHKEPPFEDLFSALSPAGLVENVNKAAASGSTASDVVPLVEEYKNQVEATVQRIERRLIYYSRLASLGVLSAMILHEVRNNTHSLGRLSRNLRTLLANPKMDSASIQSDLELADTAIRSLERLADRFAPLASRAYLTRRRDSNLAEIVRDAISMREKEIRDKNIVVETVGRTNLTIAVDPGDLLAIFLNLLDNALYWLVRSQAKSKKIVLQIGNKVENDRIQIEVHDSGPGIRDGDEERIFWPGVTRKEEGLGMGLTVAAEIIAQHGGRLYLIKPGLLRGASFGFRLPILKP